jgi:hypothetical protein
MPQRRFFAPWKAEEHDACFIVRDRTGLNLAYVFFQTRSQLSLGDKAALARRSPSHSH